MRDPITWDQLEVGCVTLHAEDYDGHFSTFLLLERSSGADGMRWLDLEDGDIVLSTSNDDPVPRAWAVLR